MLINPNKIRLLDVLLVVFKAKVGIDVNSIAFVIKILAGKIASPYFYSPEDQALVPNADASTERCV